MRQNRADSPVNCHDACTSSDQCEYLRPIPGDAGVNERRPAGYLRDALVWCRVGRMSGEHAPGHNHHDSHHHSHDPGGDVMVRFTREYWDDRYRSAERIWSGHVNPQLAAVAADLRPGVALDAGSGEGGDAIWLAERGWQVTALDVSAVARERATARAAELGAEVAGRISWQLGDVLTWDPAPQQFDLVSAQFLHLPGLERESVHRRLAAAVRPGGTLLIVGHHPSDLETTVRRPRIPDLMVTAEQMATNLDASEWDISTSSPEREATDADGQTVVIRDAVLRAVRQK